MKPLIGVKNNIIPREKHEFKIAYHCFVPLTMSNEKVVNHFILFCLNTGLLIKYDERNKTFHYEKLPICPALNDFKSYSFVYLFDFIFLFGGYNSKYEKVKNVYKYSMKEKTWSEFKFTLPMEISNSFAILSDDDTNVHIIGGWNAKHEIQKMHVSMNIEPLFEKEELLKMAKKHELKKEMNRMKLERPYIIPFEKERMIEDEKENKVEIEIPKKWKEMETQIQTFENKLKELDEEKRTEPNKMNWDDIWSIDGEFQQTKTNDLIQMNEIPSTIRTLVLYQLSLKDDVNITSKDFEEIIKKQKSIRHEINEKSLEKVKLKKQADGAILNYTKCIEQYNHLCSIEREILIRKQQKKQQIIAINEIQYFNNKVMERFNELNDKLQKLIEENNNWIEKEWSELEKKWSTWNSQEISIFIGHTLKCKKSKINQIHEIIKKNKIDRKSLSKLSENGLMSIFNFEMLSQACNICDSFNEICKKYPISVTDSDKDAAEQVIPKEYLCPLSNSIMNDPVIALNGITYDRSSIMNQYKSIPNSSSLFIGENLRLFSDYGLKQNIQNFLKNSK
ncbi:viral A-type inclusion protein [Reticulomyxa filosa]|uniref:Viral A-type inclusion protein n=1 Tax=Reticulomyxa filosa TaxID=46433 RepID=X6P9X3_RETFI|nr:viral A-type inclusion protein [Reticulomyxa filosa]|eukprot:ETO34908.1 viral A-type inclusion protein [Reticulomyxa filosa]